MLRAATEAADVAPDDVFVVAAAIAAAEVAAMRDALD
jgi:hypothetical protein